MLPYLTMQGRLLNLADSACMYSWFQKWKVVTGCFLDFFFVLILQIRRIVKNYGLVVISREGSNPEKYVYEHDILHKYKVFFSLF